MKFLHLFLSAQLLGSIASAQIKITPIKSLSGLPTKTERTISISTNESSYLDVDISPDGSTILFTCLGELFSLPAKGGIATQLTRGLAINRCPLWSPDGKLIAYESDGTGLTGLHVTNLTGSFRKALAEGPFTASLKFQWFPDSKQISVGREVYHLTGVKSFLPIAIGRSQDILGFSTNGRFVYLRKFISSDSTAIVKYDRLKQETTNEKAVLLVFNNRPCDNARVSSNGEWLTYIKCKNLDPSYNFYTPADSLMAIDLKTGKEKLLAHLNIKFTTGFLNKQHYSFSADSKYLFIAYGGKIHRIEIETGKNDIIPFTANVKVDMGSLDYNRGAVSLDSLQVKYIRSASKSPDGNHLVFSALNRIYIQDLPSGKPRILINQSINQFQPVYSPDGKWICYVSWSDVDGGHVWRVPSQGGSAEQITNVAGLYQHPSWSPDGNKILIISSKNHPGKLINSGKGQLQIISLMDKKVKVIEVDVPFFNRPSFCQSENQVVFTPNQEKGDNKIWPILVSRNVESKEESALAHALQNNFIAPIREVILSPDKRYLVFVFNEELYLVPMAGIGGVQNIFDIKNPVQLIRFARGALDPNWEEMGKVLSWTTLNNYFRIDPNKIIDAAEHLNPNKIQEGLPQTKIIDVDIAADETIALDIKVPRFYGIGFIALKNVRIITMQGNHIIENGTVLIHNGRFVSLGATDKVIIPRAAAVFDLEGKTLVPGFIDMHNHLGWTFQKSWQGLLDFSYGTTTKRNPAGTLDEFGYNELIETGQVLGPRAFSVGRPVRPDFYKLNSLHEAKVIAGTPIKYGASYIKQYSQDSRLQRQLLLQACKSARVNMTNEVEKEPLFCIGQFKDGSTGVEHNPEWGEVYGDVIKLVAKSGTYFCPTIQVCYGQEEGKGYFRKLYGQAFLDRSSRFLPDSNDWYRQQLSKDMSATTLDSGFLLQSRIDARIKHAGGKIIMGSHGEDQGIGAHWEIWALQMGGLTNMEALQTATITAAEALGMQKELGSIEVGKIADLIILDKNPLEDIHNTTSIKYVMKAGVLYESESLDEIWPERKKCPDWKMKEQKPEVKSQKSEK